VTTRPEDLAQALVARRKAANAAHAHRAVELRSALDAVIEHAVRDRAIRRAWLIGSLARGDFGVGSDVDVVVEGLAPERFASFWAVLCERLETEVDLLRLEELPPSFRARVLEEGIPLVQ
jgi:predicted nucleotidyltransferase